MITVTEHERGRLRLDFKYSQRMVDEVKAMAGSKWNKDGKFWTVTDNQRNRFVLDFLARGNIVFEQYDKPLLPFSPRREETREHQAMMVRHMLTRQGSIIAADMGCIDADAIVNANGQDIPLHKVEPGDWVRSQLGQTLVRETLDRGKRDTISLAFRSGRRLHCTPCHEILTVAEGWLPAGNLRPGDRICTLQDGDVLEAVRPGGQRTVFDLVCTDPDRTFTANGIIVHNCGKSLAAIELLEHLMPPDCWYVAPKVALLSVKLEFLKWKAAYHPRFMTYEELVKLVKTGGLKAPQVLILDEGSKAKNSKSQRGEACRHVADAIRERYPKDWHVHLLSGTPAPKNPSDWWNLLEIARPGFIKEGTVDKFTDRYALRIKETTESGITFPRLKTWRDDPTKCQKCGEVKDHPLHAMDDMFKAMSNVTGQEVHHFLPSKDEIGAFYERVKPLVMRVRIEDVWKELPEYNIRRVQLPVSPYLKKMAKLVVRTARTPAQARISLRELSDGFQYVDVPNPCPTHGLDAGCDCDYDRSTRSLTRTDCPKDEALVELLDEFEDDGRLIVFGAFEASIDRICEAVSKQGWDFIRRDGRGWMSSYGESDPFNLIPQFQREKGFDKKLAFIGHPKSVAMGITLTASKASVYYGNTDDTEDKLQSMARIRRPGSRGCNIIELLHLPVDAKVLDNLNDKRDMMLLTMGDMMEGLD